MNDTILPPSAPETTAPPRFEMVGDIAQLFDALAKARAAFKPIVRSKTVRVQPREGREYTFTYAPIESIHDATRDALSANGLSLVDPYYSVDGGYALLTLLVHSSGAYLRAAQFIDGVKRWVTRDGTPQEAPLKIQELGSELTFRRRYATQCILGVNAEDDDDGNTSEGNQFERVPPKRREPAPLPAKAERKSEPPPAQLADADIADNMMLVRGSPAAKELAASFVERGMSDREEQVAYIMQHTSASPSVLTYGQTRALIARLGAGQ